MSSQPIQIPALFALVSLSKKDYQAVYIESLAQFSLLPQLSSESREEIGKRLIDAQDSLKIRRAFVLPRGAAETAFRQREMWTFAVFLGAFLRGVKGVSAEALSSWLSPTARVWMQDEPLKAVVQSLNGHGGPLADIFELTLKAVKNRKVSVRKYQEELSNDGLSEVDISSYTIKFRKLVKHRLTTDSSNFYRLEDRLFIAAGQFEHIFHVLMKVGPRRKAIADAINDFTEHDIKGVNVIVAGKAIHGFSLLFSHERLMSLEIASAALHSDFIDWDIAAKSFKKQHGDKTEIEPLELRDFGTKSLGTYASAKIIAKELSPKLGYTLALTQPVTKQNA